MMQVDRRTFVGGSEVAALFGEHPYVTKYQLFMQKAGRLPEKKSDERMEAGQWMEPAVANWAAYKKVWVIAKAAPVPARNRIGGSPDYDIQGFLPGVLEIKTTDWLMAKRWDADDDPPLAWQLQLQHYLGLTGCSWGALAVLVGGNDLRIFRYDFRPAIWNAIQVACAEFWASIDAGTPPAPDWTADAAIVARIYAASVKGKTLDLTGDNRVPILADEYLAAAAEAKAAEARKDAARAEILAKIGDADLATCGAYKISAAAVAASTYTATRAAYRTMRITRKEPK